MAGEELTWCASKGSFFDGIKGRVKTALYITAAASLGGRYVVDERAAKDIAVKTQMSRLRQEGVCFAHTMVHNVQSD